MSEDDYEYHFHKNKKPSKTYISSRKQYNGGTPQRIASKVMDTDGIYHHVVLNDELVLRSTHNGRQEIVAKFYEDGRRIHTLTLQRWNSEKNKPLERVYFSFVGKEIDQLISFLNNIKRIHFPNAGSVNVHDDDLHTVGATKEQVKALLSDNQELLIQLAENEVTTRDITALGYRRSQLARFNRLLSDPEFFKREATGQGPESVWQTFFQNNPWIFGYGLSYVFMDTLDQRGLEQVVRGHSIASPGKRVDALMKTRAEISSLCFVEIKRHDADLLNREPYRPGVWSPAKDLVGGIAQVQETVRAAINSLPQPFRASDSVGNPTGETLFNIEPRSYLVIGSLKQFETENGVNESKFKSFEMFRRNVRQPEIITFDELFHRAKFIVEQGHYELDATAVHLSESQQAP